MNFSKSRNGLVPGLAPVNIGKQGLDVPQSEEGPAFDLLQKNTITAIPAFCVRDGRAYDQGWLPLSGLFLFLVL